MLRSQEGTLLQSKDEIKQRWTQYCSDLYRDHGGGDRMVQKLEEITSSTSDEDPHDIMYSEIQAAIHSLKKNKSPGSDGITAEMLEAEGEQLARRIHKLCNKAWQEGTIPGEWRKSLLVPIPKKGDLSNFSNYRTISLINYTGKVLLTVLLNRLKSHLDLCLSEEQAGFQKGRSTIHQILSLRLIAEKATRQGKKYIIVSSTFKKHSTRSNIKSYGLR